MSGPALVLDASALVHAVTHPGAQAAELRARLATSTVHAPHLLDAETGNVLRRRVMSGDLSVERGALLLVTAPALVDHRYDAALLMAPAWALRENITFYDALYAALAASLDLPLVTGDGRLSRAPGLPCQVEVVSVR